MKRNIKSFMVMSVAVFCSVTMISCDSGPNSELSEDLTVADRLDLSNPLATVTMPKRLIEGDIISHNLDAGSLLIARGFTEGFDNFEEIVVDSTGSITVREGNSSIPNYNYIYDQNGVFDLARENGYDLSVSNGALRTDFEARMDALQDSSVADFGSLAEVIEDENSDIDELNDVLVVALEAVGFLGNDQGDSANFGTFPDEVATNTVFRRFRSIAYTPTSTNSEVSSTGIIRGTMTITDTYINVRILSGDERGRRVSVEPSFRVVNINNIDDDDDGDNLDRGVTFSGLIQSTEVSNGNFILELNN